MNINPRIVHIDEKRLVGMSVRATQDDLMTIDLWKKFMPRRKEIKNAVNNWTYSVQFFDSIPDPNNPRVEFTKWAAVEVYTQLAIPEDMEGLTIEAGKYAVFTHEGLSENFGQTLQYVLQEWLPNSTFALAHRPHFSVMDHRYLGPMNPESAEDIYLPIE